MKLARHAWFKPLCIFSSVVLIWCGLFYAKRSILANRRNLINLFEIGNKDNRDSNSQQTSDESSENNFYANLGKNVADNFNNNYFVFNSKEIISSNADNNNLGGSSNELQEQERNINQPQFGSSDSSSSSKEALIFRQKISIKEIDRRFCPRTKEQCEDECQCDDNFSPARNLEEWENTLANASLHGRSLFKAYEYVYPWELDYLSRPPLKDFAQLPDLNQSKVWFYSSNLNGGGDGGGGVRNMSVVKCERYERLRFRVDLVSSNGKPRTFGGDELRVWLNEYEPPNTSKRLGSSGYVNDLGNGSYVVTVSPAWTGRISLNIGVVYPREYIRVALHHSRLGSNRFILGLFKNAKAEEVTVCHSTPNVPGRSCICNYTTTNTVPFYCGRPLNQWLSCKDWTSVWPTSQPPFKRVTAAEAHLEEGMSRYAGDAVIRQTVVLDVDDNPDGEIQLPPCYKTQPLKTWQKLPPRGFWSKGPKWNSMICQEPELTSQWVLDCLKNSQVWLIGDSNVVRIRTILCAIIECNYVPQFKNWPEAVLGRNEKYNISVFFNPHEQPLYLRRIWMNLYMNGGITKYFKSIPSTGRHFVIIHYFLHLASSHLSAFELRLVNLRNALRELFKRNPEIVVGFRGPHISTVQWVENHMFGGDVMGQFMLYLIQQIFDEDLKKKVVFLDGWDMSTSLKNEQLHPSNRVPEAMLRTLLAFQCPP